MGSENKIETGSLANPWQISKNVIMLQERGRGAHYEFKKNGS